MLRILKSRNLILHGAHVYHLGIPAIFALASAYAADRISRKLFFDTLNLFVRFAGIEPWSKRRMQAHHLEALGIPESDANKLPIEYFWNQNIWLIAGLFNGVLDMEDFDRLMNPERKGEFLFHHFGLHYDGSENFIEHDYPFFEWQSYQLLLRNERNYRSPGFQSQIRPACAMLEYSRDLYTATDHYALRLAAASLKGERLEVISPFEDYEHMKEVFAEVFQIVEPDYEPEFRSWTTFTFKEPAGLPPKDHQRKAAPSRRSSSESENEDDCMRARRRLFASISASLRETQSGLESRGLELPEDLDTLAWKLTEQVMKTSEPKKTRPLSCVIV